ncbi:MAG: histidine phosphatase family protein [Nocardioides sp.]|nr:histidine phosphatase family protein [Nocardioides sp.]
MEPRWTEGPVELTLVRHGESVGNRADNAAREASREQLDLDDRDADVALSDTGREQAGALAGWIKGSGVLGPPTLVISSPYRRAAETAARTASALGVDLVLDERLRERDLGVFDGLTGVGIRARYPEEAERRTKVGKFYYQPPSGESWADVTLRVRSLLQDLRHGYDGERLWLFTHQAVIMSFRYVLEGLDEETLLGIDREVRIPNASLTTYRRDGDRLDLVSFADTAAVDAADAEVTHEEPQAGAGHDAS